MTDPRKNNEKVLSTVALERGSRIVSDEEVLLIQVSPHHAILVPEARVGLPLQGVEVGGVYYPIEPHELDTRIVWAVKRAFEQEFQGDAFARFHASFFHIERDKKNFLAGAAAGAAEVILEEVRETIKGLQSSITAIFEFYRAVYDPELWGRALQIWRSDPKSEQVWQDLAQYLRQQHPALWIAATGFPRFEAQVQAFIKQCQDDIAELFATISDGLIDVLQERINQFVSLEGKAYQQGKLLGSVVTFAVFSVVLVSANIAHQAKTMLKLGRKLLLGRMKKKNVTALLNATLPEAGELSVRAQALREIERQARKLYDELAVEIRPYKQLKARTDEFNARVATQIVFEPQKHDISEKAEYVGLVLDADHIAEGRTFSWHEKEWKAIGVNSQFDMDAMAVHTEFHIRTGITENRAGTGLVELFKMEDALKEGTQTVLAEIKSLTKMKIDFIGQDRGKYPTLLSLIEAYEEFYKTKLPTYWPRVEKWFTSPDPTIGIKARLKLKGIK